MKWLHSVPSSSLVTLSVTLAVTLAPLRVSATLRWAVALHLIDLVL
jgi:hypothetical protein